MSLARKVTLNASALGVGRVAAAGLGIVSVGISTRYLGVEAYGALAVALAFATLLNVVADGGIWTIGARELAKRPQDTRRIFGTILTLGLGLSLLAVAVALAVAFLVFGGEDDALTREGILILLLTVPLAAPFGAVNAYFIAAQQAWVGAIGVVTSSVVQLIVLVVVTSLDAGFSGVVGAYVAASVAQGLVILPLARGRVTLRPSWDLALARQLLRWTLPLSGATLVYSLYWRIDILLLSLLASERQVGLYGLSFRAVDALVLLPQFVMITLLPEFARLADHRERLQQIAQKAFTVMQVGALALVTIFIAFAREIVTVIGGPEFGDAALVLEILIVGVGLTYMGNVLAQVLLAVNRQNQLFGVALALLPANVALNLALIPLWGARGAAVGFTASELLHVALLALLYRRYSALPRPQRALQLLAAAGLVAAVASAKLLPFLDGVDPALVLAVGFPLSAGTFVAALYAFRCMPPELHANLMSPAWRVAASGLRLRRGQFPSH